MNDARSVPTPRHPRLPAIRLGILVVLVVLAGCGPGTRPGSGPRALDDDSAAPPPPPPDAARSLETPSPLAPPDRSADEPASAAGPAVRPAEFESRPSPTPVPDDTRESAEDPSARSHPDRPSSPSSSTSGPADALVPNRPSDPDAVPWMAGDRSEPVRPDPGVSAYRPTPEMEQVIRDWLDTAFERLMADDPRGSLDALERARYVEGWPQSKAAADIHFWLGQTFEELGEQHAAAHHYRQVLLKYAHSPLADRATARLRAITP